MINHRAWEHEESVMRLAKADDAQDYYNQNYNPLDAEVARLTGSKAAFSKEEVLSLMKMFCTMRLFSGLYSCIIGKNTGAGIACAGVETVEKLRKRVT